MSGDEPNGRAQAHHAAKSSGNPQRTPEIRSLPQRKHTRRQPGAATAGRTSGCQLQIPRISGGSENIIKRIGAGCELRRVRLSQNNRAGLLEPADDKRILLGHVIRVHARAKGGAHVGHRRDVLDPDGQPMQWPQFLSGHDLLLRPSSVTKHFRRQGNHRIDLVVPSLDLVQTGLDYLDGRELPLADEAAQFNSGLVCYLLQFHRFSAVEARTSLETISPSKGLTTLPIAFLGSESRITSRVGTL